MAEVVGEFGGNLASGLPRPTAAGAPSRRGGRLTDWAPLAPRYRLPAQWSRPGYRRQADPPGRRRRLIDVGTHGWADVYPAGHVPYPPSGPGTRTRAKFVEAGIASEDNSRNGTIRFDPIWPTRPRWPYPASISLAWGRNADPTTHDAAGRSHAGLVYTHTGGRALLRIPNAVDLHCHFSPDSVGRTSRLTIAIWCNSAGGNERGRAEGHVGAGPQSHSFASPALAAAMHGRYPGCMCSAESVLTSPAVVSKWLPSTRHLAWVPGSSGCRLSI